MKLNLLLVTLVLLAQAGGQTKPEVEKLYAHWLTPKSCEESRPDDLYIKHLEADGLKWDSEQARDMFHEEYAEVLAKRTDQKHPDAAKFRKPLLAAFKSTFEFIRSANGNTSTAHMMARLPAELEWDISQGFESKFNTGLSGEYTFDDIRNLARIYQTSQRQFRDYQEPGDIQPALDHLKAAEQLMGKEAIIYFRARLVSLIAQYIGR